MLRKIAVLVAVCMLLMTLSASALAEGAYTAYSTEELLNEAAQMWEELNSRASEKAAEKA